jgi:hypothetical protein
VTGNRKQMGMACGRKNGLRNNFKQALEGIPQNIGSGK